MRITWDAVTWDVDYVGCGHVGCGHVGCGHVGCGARARSFSAARASCSPFPTCPEHVTRTPPHVTQRTPKSDTKKAVAFSTRCAELRCGALGCGERERLCRYRTLRSECVGQRMPVPDSAEHT
eukprot:983261-Rhodomonas_salina.2